MRGFAFNPFTGNLDWVENPDEVRQSVAITFDTGTITLQAVASGALLFDVGVQVLTQFDGAATLQLGTTTSPSLVFVPGEVDLATPDQYANPEVLEFSAGDFLVLTIAQTGATQGTGKLWFRYRSQP